MSSPQTESAASPQWRDFYGQDRFLLLSGLAIVIGVISSIGAYVLLMAIRFFTNLFFFQSLSFETHSPADNQLGLWVIIVPAIGGLIAGLAARYGTEKIRGHGIPEAIEAILYGKSRMSPKVAALKPIVSGIVIGSGGPFGAEGPVIVTGGAAASLLAQAVSLTSVERKALLVAGACAGMTAVFGTPVAAVLFAIELMLFELRPRSLLPVAIACAVAGFLRPLWYESGPLFPMATAEPTAIAIVSALIAGLAAGALSMAVTHFYHYIEERFERLPIHWMWWPAIGGLVVGIGGYFQPRALGVGYDVIGDLLADNLVLSTAASLVIVKAIIWAVALGSNTSGGTLAPLMTMGAGLGVVIGRWLPGGDIQLWVLVCMAATMSGTLGAPLMAIVFAFGLTHDANALLPLLLGCIVSYAFTVIVMPHSILTEKIVRRGRRIYREYGVDPLEQSFIADVMTRDVKAIPAQMPVAEVITQFFGGTQSQRAYPVQQDGRLLDMVERNAFLNLEADELTQPIAKLIGKPSPVFALSTETCRMIASRMAAMDIERLPVIDSPETRKLVGIVSRSDLVKPRRAAYEEESQRERFFLTSTRWPKAGPRDTDE